jgi:hypothetical protein
MRLYNNHWIQEEKKRIRKEEVRELVEDNYDMINLNDDLSNVSYNRLSL